jgi:arylsulfatase
MQHARRLIRAFEESVQTEELIPAGAPIDFVPSRTHP